MIKNKVLNVVWKLAKYGHMVMKVIGLKLAHLSQEKQKQKHYGGVLWVSPNGRFYVGHIPKKYDQSCLRPRIQIIWATVVGNYLFDQNKEVK